MTELADTAGYALGAFAAKDPALRGKIESIYKQYAAGGITPTAALNAGIAYLIDTDDIVQVILAHKVVRLIEQRAGLLSGMRLSTSEPLLTPNCLKPEKKLSATWF